MEPEGPDRLPDLWICPRCGARLVSRNLSHSCGQFTLEDLFSRADSSVLAVARWLGSERIVKTADYGPRWRGHFVMVRTEADLDDELRGWLQESYDVVGLQRGLRSPADADPDA